MTATAPPSPPNEPPTDPESELAACVADPEAALKQRGIQVERRWTRNTLAMLVTNEETGEQTVFIVENASALLERFLLLHELAHILLGHRGCSFYRGFLFRPSSSKEEHQADQLVAAAAIPVSDLLKATEGARSLDDVARTLGVPRYWVKKRLKMLDDLL
ncbi:ImmA/IrrE family metallo-endopeptidase [Streptomyces sp. N35]|uniref:ImmA/IrrE family metallo-endopeptidase n=1 Tax=Streptomyces sp. N35 TaxID=2795730 RepID=UPI0018F5B569|nr:ImmA/IrrE family metallo-endopeptidase [Streptomyces sp. N35]